MAVSSQLFGVRLHRPAGLGMGLAWLSCVVLGPELGALIWAWVAWQL